MSETNAQKVSWSSAYIRYLKDPAESTVLKILPLIMLGLLPEIIVSNLIPVLGIAEDTTGILATSAVLYRTYRAVQRHR